ncbi:unnamed protein product [Caenorhabditis auriculariae]|uniref:Very long-chain specific acyl-CoA dehydrogenase, mitochondrial n=1 Tax=Caenorhabditis auriculariae TaxID=2777116 RepID=A0A8S1H9Q2_9PELO|nr:unnamed protein product [Caenorhabditis auriculariae]
MRLVLVRRFSKELDELMACRGGRMLSTLSKKTARAVISAGNGASLRFASQATAAKAPNAASENKPKTKKAEESASFCMNLFRGRAVSDQVFPYPLKLTDEQKETLGMILSPTEKFLSEVNNVAKNDEKAEIPMEVLKQFAELGGFGAVVPPEYEGAGLNNSQMARLAEVVGAHDLGFGVVMGAHQSIGYKGILLFGTDAQKQKYLPDLATGRKFAAFCLTEPSSGSDANSIRTRAELSADGKHYILNGGKIWISNGGFADVFTVFAQLPVKKADGTTKNAVTAFIVERGFGGITNGPPEKKMGIKGSNTAEVTFENVKVPVENLLGQEGEGFKVAMNILNNGRFGIPAACTGSMKHCIQKTVEHITTRTQFGKKLEEFGNVQEKLTNMVARLYATESIVYMLAANMDRGISDYQLEAAIGKVLASEKRLETGLERVLRDLRIFRIFEGANDVMRLFVALTGSLHAGKHLQQVASGGISSIFGEVVRRATGSSTGADFDKVIDPALKDSAAALDANIKLFGKTLEGLLMKHKKGIIDRQYELIRVADAAIDIYSSVAVLSRCTRSIKEKSSSAAFETDIANFYVQTASKRAADALKEAASPDATSLSLIPKISKAICSNGGLPQQHPADL